MQIDRDGLVMHHNISEILAAFDIFIENIDVKQITVDSRTVEPKSLFIALKGTKNEGKQYIKQAIHKGASLVLQDIDDERLHANIHMQGDVQVVNFYQLGSHLGEICSAFYEHASSKMDSVAVTGTNGKTSITQLIAQLSALSGQPAGTIGTLGVNLYAQGTEQTLTNTSNTTPDAASAHYFCQQLKTRGAIRFAIEASSHGLDQNRLQAVKIDTAVFSNLSQDHLDYHQSMEQYARAKRKLLDAEGLRHVVLNLDDPESQNWLAAKPEGVICIGYSMSPETHKDTHELPYCYAHNLSYHNRGCDFLLNTSWGKAEISMPLLADFNVANLLAALSALLSQGLAFNTLVACIPHITGVPGRMEIFTTANNISVVVDYAHTPDALEKALLACRKHTSGKLSVVFGCGGERDKGKRQLMGQIAERLADSIVLTQDNSRCEDPCGIIADIMFGIEGHKRLEIELHRQSAVDLAIKQSQSNDVVLLAGKGHEQYLEVNNNREPYNERLYVQQLISELTL